MKFSRLIEGSAGMDFKGNNTYTDILLPNNFPRKAELLRAILRRKLAAIIEL